MKYPLTPSEPRVVYLGEYKADNDVTLRAFRSMLPNEKVPEMPRLVILHDKVPGETWGCITRSRATIVGQSGEPAEKVALRGAKERFTRVEVQAFYPILVGYNAKTSVCISDASKMNAERIRKQLEAILSKSPAEYLAVSQWLTDLATTKDTYQAGIVDWHGYPTQQTLRDRHPAGEYFIAYDNGHSITENSLQDVCAVACCSGIEPNASRKSRIYDSVGIGEQCEPGNFNLIAEVISHR